MSKNFSVLPLAKCLSLVIDNRGKTPKASLTDKKYRIISANNVKFNGLEKENKISYGDQETYDTWMNVEFQKGDILLTSEAPAGQAMLWDSDEKIIVAQRLFGLRTNDLVDQKYLKYYLQSPTGQFEIYKHSSGSTVFGISAKMFDQILVRFPDKVTQLKVGDVLYQIDKKIEINKKIISRLDELAKTIFKYWFNQFNFPDQNHKPYKSSGGEMKWDELLGREVPISWATGRLKDHIKIDRGVSYKSSEIADHGVPLINLNSFYLTGAYKAEGIKFFNGTVNESKKLFPGDLVISTTDVTRNALIIGKSFMLPNIFESDVIASCDVARVEVAKSLDNSYLDMIFNSAEYHSYIKGFASGTLVLHLDTKGIDWYKVVIPEKKVLDQFAKIKKDFENKKSLAIKENFELNKLRDWLLPLLISGQASIQ
jgi:type I restriction enzyme S subunit